MTEENQSSAVRKHNNKWRVVDIVVAAIIAVASGVIFWGWDIVCTAPLALFEAVTPGFEGLLNAFWLFAGPLAAIIVRKPGAALFAETLAAALELTMGNQWGVGGSLIVDPNGVIVAQAKTLGDEVLVADVDLDACRQGKEKMFNFAAHRRPEQYARIVDQVGAERPPVDALLKVAGGKR